MSIDSYQHPHHVAMPWTGTQENPLSATRDRRWQIALAMPIKNRTFTKKSLQSFPIVSIQHNPYDTLVIISFATQTLRKIAYTTIMKALQHTSKISIQLSTIARTASEFGYVVSATWLNPTPTEIILAVKSEYGVALTGTYSADDIATITFPNLCYGWEMSHENLEPIGIRKRYKGQIVDSVGDFFAQELAVSYDNYGTTELQIYQQLDLSHLAIPMNAQMRLGCRYNVLFENADGTVTTDIGMVRLFLTQGSIMYPETTLNENTYGDIYTVFNSTAVGYNGGNNLTIGVSFINGSGSNAGVRFWLDEIWLEHDGGMEVGGKVTLSDYPVRSSLSYTDSDDIALDRLADGDYTMHNMYGNPNESTKWIITSDWKHSHTGNYNMFKYIESLQRDGWLVNLHPKLPETNEVLTGKITVKDIKKSNFALHERADYTVTFQEM